MRIVILCQKPEQVRETELRAFSLLIGSDLNFVLYREGKESARRSEVSELIKVNVLADAEQSYNFLKEDD